MGERRRPPSLDLHASGFPTQRTSVPCLALARERSETRPNDLQHPERTEEVEKGVDLCRTPRHLDNDRFEPHIDELGAKRLNEALEIAPHLKWRLHADETELARHRIAVREVFDLENVHLLSELLAHLVHDPFVSYLEEDRHPRHPGFLTGTYGDRGNVESPTKEETRNSVEDAGKIIYLESKELLHSGFTPSIS